MVNLWVFFCVIGLCSALPELTCNGPNEVATTCMSLCPQFCNISYTEIQCNDKCEPGCDCQPNYARNKNGICVSYDECEPPSFLPECDENEVVVRCTDACPEQLCQYLPGYEYLCATVKSSDKVYNDQPEKVAYECPIGFDPNNIPAILISKFVNTIVGVDYPHPTKYKRPELIEFAKTITYLAPSISQMKGKENIENEESLN